MREIDYSERSEVVDGTKIGRLVFDGSQKDARAQSADDLIKLLGADRKVRESVARGMHNNSPADAGDISTERGLSAYFSWDPGAGALIVEWGEIGPDGEAKLHTFLNRSINFTERHRKGMIVRSGHMTRSDQGDQIFLIDSLFEESDVDRSFPEYPIVKRLNDTGAVVIGTDGFPVNNAVIEEKEVKTYE